MLPPKGETDGDRGRSFRWSGARTAHASSACEPPLTTRKTRSAPQSREAGASTERETVVTNQEIQIPKRLHDAEISDRTQPWQPASVHRLTAVSRLFQMPWRQLAH